MGRPVQVIVAEDHPVFRQGLADALRGAGYEVVAAVGDGPAAAEAIRAHSPAIAILDIEMPRLSGFDVARECAASHPDVQVVFLTMHRDGAMLRRAIELGARGYVLKDAAIGEITACLTAVASGRMYVSGALDAPRQPETARLTRTERRVLELIADGGTSAEVAQALGVSPKTIENHRGSICRKLGIRGPQALLRYALSQRPSMSRDRGSGA